MAITPLLGSQIVFMDSDNILVWNVHGLNSPTCHIVVADMVTQERISLVCIQETKLSVLDDSLVMSICGVASSPPSSLLMAPEVASWWRGAPRHGWRRTPKFPHMLSH
jgi:hypothetical protein